MTNSPKGSAETSTLNLKYDAWNRLAKADTNGDADFADANDVTYKYDGLGRRIAKDFVGGAGVTFSDEETYYNEGWQALETRRNGSTNAYEQTVWDQKYVDAPIVRYRDANGHTTATATGDGTLEEVLYVSYDRNFNVTGVWKEDQACVERFTYQPYGERTVLNGQQQNANSFTQKTGNASEYGWERGFQDLRLDGETSIYDNRARFLNPSTGTFDSRDPLMAKLSKDSSFSPFIFSDPVDSKATNIIQRYVGNHNILVLQSISLYQRHNVLNGMDPSGKLVKGYGIGGSFVAVMGAGIGIYRVWDECGNTGFVFAASARLGAEAGINFGVNGTSGCLSGFIKGNTYDLNASAGVLGFNKSNGTNGAGDGYAGSVGPGADVGVSGGYGGSVPLGTPDLSHPCPCDCPVEKPLATGSPSNQSPYVQPAPTETGARSAPSP
jgi:hypothetical protein